MSEVKKCPKCGGEMEVGHLANAIRWASGRSMWTMELGRRIYGYRCRNCGYVEFYTEE